MVRTQIQLEEADHRRLKQWARKRGISLSEAVRRGIAVLLAQEDSAPSRDEIVKAALAACGRFRDPRGSAALGRDHDDHLPDAFTS